MIAFTIHAYTTDSTEGILLSDDHSLKEEQAAELWWKQNTDKGTLPINSWAEFTDIFAIEREFTKV